MSHHAGLHTDIEKRLPPHVHFAYDGLEIDSKLFETFVCLLVENVIFAKVDE